MRESRSLGNLRAAPALDSGAEENHCIYFSGMLFTYSSFLMLPALRTITMYVQVAGSKVTMSTCLVF
jgi:hypothetical protein